MHTVTVLLSVLKFKTELHYHFTYSYYLGFIPKFGLKLNS